MNSEDVLSLLVLLRRAGADVWIGGGWGIDALVGERTRDHRDLDLMHRADQEPAVLAALSAAGFTEMLDQRPVRFVMTAPDGREIDLHPRSSPETGRRHRRPSTPGAPSATPPPAS